MELCLDEEEVKKVLAFWLSEVHYSLMRDSVFSGMVIGQYPFKVTLSITEKVIPPAGGA